MSKRKRGKKGQKVGGREEKREGDREKKSERRREGGRIFAILHRQAGEESKREIWGIGVGKCKLVQG